MFGKFFKSFSNNAEIESLNKSFVEKENKLNQEIRLIEEDLKQSKQETFNSEINVKDYKLKFDQANTNLTNSQKKETDLLSQIEILKNENVSLNVEKNNSVLSVSKESELEIDNLKKQIAKHEQDFKILETENNIVKERLKGLQSQVQTYILKEVEKDSEILNFKNKLLKLSESKNVDSTDTKANVSSKKKILIVDDSAIMRNLQKNILENANFEVVLAKNGLEGKETIEKEVFDLVVTDVEMPHMNGLELTKWIKSNYKTPIIIVTSATSEEGKQRVIDANPDSFIIKDEFNPKSFLSAVEKLL
ncbi:MAG: response regulator [Candidatus Sericytochromatia bacterium]|nr:response regulator [Candidatus Sericytochromatia bacterium]